MLLVNNIQFNRNEKIIFNNISLSVAPNKIVYLTGKNGSGKTTLLKTITNILEPSDGEIFWMGKHLKKNILSFYKNSTLIFDKPSSEPKMTVLENINFWKRIASSDISYEGILKLLTILNIDEYINTKVIYLSFGEIKKLELTRLIIEQKKLWILDEPYSGLDSKSITIINDTFIDHISNQGMIIFTSHQEPDLRNLEKISID